MNNGPTLFNLVMITLVEICAVFWVGAQLWLLFVLQPVHDAHNDNKDAPTNVQAINLKVQQRFERVWAVPTLLVLLLANIGSIVGQILSVSGQWSSAFSPSLLWQIATTGQFGTFWMLREISTFIALVLAVYVLLFKERPRAITTILPSVNLLLGAIIFITMSITGNAADVSSNFQTYAVLVEWFHLVATALWVGSILYIATAYLPVLQQKSLGERAHSLVTTLPYYARLVIAGIVIVSVTGIFSSEVHLTASQQLLDTAYGRTLLVKIVLMLVLLITSIRSLFFLRPRMAKEYKKYLFAQERVQFHQVQQLKLREERLMQRTQRLTTVLRWEPFIGLAVLLCVGLMSVFAGTLSATTTTGQQPTTSKTTVYNATAQTTDKTFTVKLNINPNRFGTNVFTVTVIDHSTAKASTNVKVSLFTTMLDMDMGTDTVALQSNGKGSYSASGELAMGGNWEIRVAIHALDGTLHEATFKLFTPF